MEKLFRQTIQLNQEELADLIGVSKSAIGMYESGLRQLSNDTYYRLQQLKEAWSVFVKEGLPPGIFLNTIPADITHYKIVVETAVQKASADAIRYSQLLEKMTKYSDLLEQKMLFIHFLLLQPDTDLFPHAVLNKIQRDVKKQLKRCSSDQQHVLAFRLKCCIVLQQLAAEARNNMR